MPALPMLVSIFPSHFSKAGRWPLSFTCCLSRRQPIPCKSCCASALQAWQPFPQVHSLPGHTFTSWSFATLRHLLWEPHHSTISVFFLKIQNRGLIFCTIFCCWVFWWNKPCKTQVVSLVRNRTGCVFNPTFLWLSLGAASQHSSACSLC